MLRCALLCSAVCCAGMFHMQCRESEHLVGCHAVMSHQSVRLSHLMLPRCLHSCTRGMAFDVPVPYRHMYVPRMYSTSQRQPDSERFLRRSHPTTRSSNTWTLDSMPCKQSIAHQAYLWTAVCSWWGNGKRITVRTLDYSGGSFSLYTGKGDLGPGTVLAV